MKTVAVALAVVAVFAVRTNADDWPAPQTKEVFSKSRDWFVRVVPGKNQGDISTLSGSITQAHARAEFYMRSGDRSYRLINEITLRNPVAPVLFLVTDRGFLVVLDNWHSMGFGDIITSYSPDGRLRAAYQLTDVFSRDEIDTFSHSVSSIWWRTDTAYVREGQQSVYVAIDQNGSELILEPETGAWQYCANRGSVHQCRSTQNGPWLPYQEPPLRK